MLELLASIGKPRTSMLDKPDDDTPSMRSHDFGANNGAW